MYIRLGISKQWKMENGKWKMKNGKWKMKKKNTRDKLGELPKMGQKLGRKRVLGLIVKKLRFRTNLEWNDENTLI